MTEARHPSVPLDLATASRDALIVYIEELHTRSAAAALPHSSTPETCLCAAWVTAEGVVFAGRRHGDCGQAAIKANCRPLGGEEAQGFITSRGRFVTRREGRALQDAAGIASADPGGYRGDGLFSEDLYAGAGPAAALPQEPPCAMCGATESKDGDWYRLCGPCRWGEALAAAAPREELALTPEGLCTACSATQYCAEHDPAAARGEEPAPQPPPVQVARETLRNLIKSEAGHIAYVDDHIDELIAAVRAEKASAALPEARPTPPTEPK